MRFKMFHGTFDSVEKEIQEWLKHINIINGLTQTEDNGLITISIFYEVC
jgi:hypothetical protein